MPDRLNSPWPASRDAAFPPVGAKRLVDKLEIHHPPTHGSRPNRAERELGMPQRLCLSRRTADRPTLEAEAAAPGSGCSASADAWIELRRPSPAVHE